jgi:uncharacterized protein
MTSKADTYQSRFAARWGHLTEPRVRALAWLLDAPDLLDASDPYWQGKIASSPPITAATEAWLARLDADPSILDAAMGERGYTRLGLYAEKLMAFYYREHGMLVAHGLQVRAARNDTVGEFDFLLDAGPGAVEHIEFATKFYLLQGQAATRFDAFLGPNLADSLGKKMRKIFEQQLALGSHPAAQALLPRPVARARALVKGWLFYPHDDTQAEAGIAAVHCRGCWCALAALDALEGEGFVVLPKLQWLAPYKGTAGVMDRAVLAQHLAGQAQPVLVATVEGQDGYAVETARTFIVPDDWQQRAAAYVTA